MSRRHETHHKAAERLLNDAVSHLVQAKTAVGYAKERNATARAVHEAAINYHTESRQVTIDRDAEADRILRSLTSVAGD